MRSLLLLIYLLASLGVYAQEQHLVLPGKLPQSHMDIGAYTSFYEDRSGDPLPLPSIQQQRFRPFQEKRNERRTASDRSRMVTWLRFTIRNTHPTDTLHLYHDCGIHGDVAYWANGQLIGHTGLILRPAGFQPTVFAMQLQIAPLSEQQFYVRITNMVSIIMPVRSTLYSGQAFWFTNYRDLFMDQYLLLAMGVMTGAILFMGLYALYRYWLTRDQSILYYALYTITCFCGCAYTLNSRFHLNLFPQKDLQSIPFYGVFYYVAVLFYMLFITKLLHTKQKHPTLHGLLTLLAVLIFGQSLFTIAQWIFGDPIINNTLYYQFDTFPMRLILWGIIRTFPMRLTFVLLLWIIIRSRTPLRAYLFVGASSIFIVSFIPVLSRFFNLELAELGSKFLNWPSFCVTLGLTIECLCFAMALAYRSRLVELESQRIQERYTQDLENQLAQRIQEIDAQNRLLKEQYLRQLNTEFERKLADTEMVALRAQMNPHFIFNCLNSIKLYTLQNDSEQASEFLTKFARLIRLVLENSRSELVTLRNELEALQLYIELEAMRFKEKLRYQILVSPEIDPQYLRIPPLLLQPFVENAIWHGLMHKPEGGTVTIEVRQPQDNLLHIEITDDGIGRVRATELKSKSAGKHKSFGMQVTADRIRMINQRYHIQTHTEILDLVDSFGEPCGTRVVLEIPV